jgi:hypothetical protein
MAATASFTGPNGQDARAAMEWGVRTATTPTTGDLLYSGQVFRSRIRERTFRGVDVNGVPFTGYSTKGPYYFYPNREVGDTGKRAGTRNHTQAQVRAARATAAKGRQAKVGGVRTPYGIKYASYAAAKSGHGAANVNLYGMEQHTHMLDTLLVKVGGMEIGVSADALMDNSEMAAFEQNQPATEMALGFYGAEAARAKGNNEGIPGRLPKREFFALNEQDLMIGEQAIVERMSTRAVHGR